MVSGGFGEDVPVGGMNERPTGSDGSAGVARPASQTLDRGLTILKHVTLAPAPLTVAEVARDAGVHRSIAYRMLRTLEDHGLLDRDESGRYAPGAGLSFLATRYAPKRRSLASHHLLPLAIESGKTAFVVVRHLDEAVTMEVAEPPDQPAHVSYRPGVRHPVDRGAPGIALLAGAPAQPGERVEVTAARARGWSESESEVIEGFRSVAAPVYDEDGVCRAALAVVFAGQTDVEALGLLLISRAVAVGADL